MAPQVNDKYLLSDLQCTKAFIVLFLIGISIIKKPNQAILHTVFYFSIAKLRQISDHAW